MPGWNAGPQALSPWCPAIAAGHVGRGPEPAPDLIRGLIDEHQTVGIEVELTIEPGPAPLQDIGAVLLGSLSGLFFRVMRWRWKKRHNAP